MATYKETAVEAMLSADASGRMRRLHGQLVLLGCKTLMPSNTDTLRFEAGPVGGRVAIAAFRGGNTEVFSFPRTYWGRRLEELGLALSSIDRRHFINPEGPGSNSQYSVRQVRISPDTIAQLEAVVSGLLARHVREVNGVE